MKTLSNINQLNNSYKEPWLQEMSNSITNIEELLKIINLNFDPKRYFPKKINPKFPIRVPRSFINRIKKKDPNDPILLQIIGNLSELENTPGYTKDPLKEKFNIKTPGLLHKYYDRVLIITKTNCAINCRYCFRKNFPYKNNLGNKLNWNKSINYIKKHSYLNEVILSGGDPLMAKDHELYWLINKLSVIPHLKRLRIHTRLPVVIPSRITNTLCSIFIQSRLRIIMVTHINHPNEINTEFSRKMYMLKQSNVILLNQSVLLKKINDNANTLASLSNILCENYILPYYLHILDKVEGTRHFYISERKARVIMKSLIKMISGFLVPKLTKDTSSANSKIILV